MTVENWDYLTTEVLTAPPQKLQLMLLDAALRHLQRTEAAWRSGQVEQGYQSLEKARAIVGEILAAIRPEIWPEVAPRIIAVYKFVYLALGEAGLTRSVDRLREATRVLEVERQTWQEVCRRMNTGHDLSGCPQETAIKFADRPSTDASEPAKPGSSSLAGPKMSRSFAVPEQPSLFSADA